MGVGAAGMRANARTWRGKVIISGPLAAWNYCFARAVGVIARAGVYIDVRRNPTNADVGY